jgi:hypothetical protein
MGRVAQRQHHAGNPESDVLGAGREQAEVDEGVEHLARVPKRGHVERHIAQPQRGKAQCLGQLGPLQVPGHGRHRAGGIGLQRHHQPQAQALGAKHAVVGAVDRLKSGLGHGVRHGALHC